MWGRVALCVGTRGVLKHNSRPQYTINMCIFKLFYFLFNLLDVNFIPDHNNVVMMAKIMYGQSRVYQTLDKKRQNHFKKPTSKADYLMQTTTWRMYKYE